MSDWRGGCSMCGAPAKAAGDGIVFDPSAGKWVRVPRDELANLQRELLHHGYSEDSTPVRTIDRWLGIAP